MSYSDFLTPVTVFYYNAAKGKALKEIIHAPSRFDSRPYKIEQCKVASRDGTMIPYFVVSGKNIELNSKNPTLLYAYGGFEIPMTANYLGSTGKVWLEKGGVYVLANIRGGGEYGPDWHRAALRENRQRAFDDFFAIAEDLIRKNITSPAHLGIRGGSNGGLLMGVAFTQRPELFNAVISEVPLANMLEYHKWLAGASWMEEYGNPEDPKMREFLRGYSPLHNLSKDKKYPEVFFLTSTKDDRVHPAHARQMVARMQELGLPVLYNENTDGGHGRATNMSDLAEYLALEFTYLYQKLF
jgi:prolyl oligopeptidase